MDEHKEHLHQTFHHLKEYSILINPSKCGFGVTALHFLGHQVDSSRICPLHDKVLVIQDFAQPDTHRGLRKFLGIINFYHRFISKCAQLLQPLNTLLSSKYEQPIQSTDVTTKAFTDIKHALAQATLLFNPKPDAPTCIMTDVSNVAIGAVLQQFIDGKWCPVSFFSTKLRPAETRYSIFDRELLTIYLSIKNF